MVSNFVDYTEQGHCDHIYIRDRDRTLVELSRQLCRRILLRYILWAPRQSEGSSCWSCLRRQDIHIWGSRSLGWGSHNTSELEEDMSAGDR